MRTVASENEPQSSRRRGRTGLRAAALRQLRLRSTVLERLEDRTLMATLPQPLRSGVPISVSSVKNPALSGTTNPQRDQAPGNETSPTIVIDPQNSQHMVAVFTRNLTGVDNSFFVIQNSQIGPQVPIYIGASYSINGGASWNVLDLPGMARTDFSADQTSGPVFFSQVTDPSVG